MRLHREERDNYVLEVTTTPELTGTWEASFDDGENWHDGTADGDNWAWLVAGPDFDAAAVGMNPADTIATIETSTAPLLRIKDDPVLDVQTGPSIRLWG